MYIYYSVNVVTREVLQLSLICKLYGGMRMKRILKMVNECEIEEGAMWFERHMSAPEKRFL